MKLAELISLLTEKPIHDCNILGLSNDSRLVKSGDLFIAYKGAVADGRLYMKQAVEKGASAIVFDPQSMPLNEVIPHGAIPILGLASHLALIASRFYQYPSRSLSVTGITGTNGKTTIAYQLAQAHGLLGHHAAYIGTLGQGDVNALNPLNNTTPDALCLQKLLYDYQQAFVEQVCMEVSSHALSQGRVEEIAFSQAIYTNLTHDHLDFHKTMSEYARAKAKLFEFSSLKFAIINQDDAHYPDMCQGLPNTCQKITYGLQSNSDVHVKAWHSTIEGSDLDVVTPWGPLQVHVNLLGEFNVYNSLATLASLLASGYAIPHVLDVMPKLRASVGRMEVVLQDPCVIIDYAHTPDALENVLTTLLKLKEGRLWVVFGCGGDRDKTKRPVMGEIASRYADVVVITSDNPRHEAPCDIINDIQAGLLPDTNTMSILDRKEAIHSALSLADAEDIVLIAGKGHEDYQQIGDVRIPFSDHAIVKGAFRKSMLS